MSDWDKPHRPAVSREWAIRPEGGEDEQTRTIRTNPPPGADTSRGWATRPEDTGANDKPAPKPLPAPTITDPSAGTEENLDVAARIQSIIDEAETEGDSDE